MKRNKIFKIWNKTENPTKRKANGFYKESGYVLQYAPYHPFSNKRGYVHEHRLIMENEMGRYLIPRKELIHHVNGKRDDNRIENLVLLNPKDHAKGHIGSRNINGRFICMSKEFNEKIFRLYDKDRNLIRIYTLTELISKTFRRGKFEYRGIFTGLKDKNGKQIYEGDVIKYSEHAKYLLKSFTAEIRYVESRCFFGYRILEKNEWGFDDPLIHSFDEHDEFGIDVLPFLEVIGNLYETPNLIKE